MSLKIEVGDLFNAVMDSNAVLVHGCNAQGVMGSGVAATVKKLYPMAFLRYTQAYKRKGLKIGQVVWSHPELSRPGVSIANAITQEFYGRTGKQFVNYDATIEALQEVAKNAKYLNKPVHLPMIGGGLGGGDVKRLTAIFQAVFHDTDATLWLKED